MPFNLIKFRIPKFRSIVNSDWIRAEDCTCLIGTNESGKTNILLALWKLNPANNEPIIPLEDYPRKDYAKYESTEGKEFFIEADFLPDDNFLEQFSLKLKEPKKLLRIIRISRSFNNVYSISFPESKLEYIDHVTISEPIKKSIDSIKNIPNWKESSVESKAIELLDNFINSYTDGKKITKLEVESIISNLKLFCDEEIGRKQKIKEILLSLVEDFCKYLTHFDSPIQIISEELKEEIIQNIPKFVYYSDYGNLDSEIYLPHVIKNFARTDLGERERAKVRTLKVLFNFVSLSAEQILDLGKETNNRRYDQHGNLIQDQAFNQNVIDLESESKRKREVLLQSASGNLTQEFKIWWEQGNYIFRFNADGNHFKIWVSDSLRPEEVELENRSKGLQWFFSFFLIFLVEREDTHSNCILLLDEPGLSLHPLAQFDLRKFLRKLSNDNQLIYTSHSPFLVDNTYLESVRAVFVDESGNSKVSHDLRKNNKVAEQSIYPVHAALGLTISDTLLLGCLPILVEGSADNIYLHLIKTHLMAQGKIQMIDEIVFIPCGGVKGMSPIINILRGRNSSLPFVILDSDNPGLEKKKQLEKGLYKEEKEKIISIDQFLGDGEYEIEDMMPSEHLARTFSKMFRGREDDFEYLHDSKKPIVDQMTEFAKKNGHELEEGWKVDIAREFSRNFISISTKISAEIESQWVKLFKSLGQN